MLPNHHANYGTGARQNKYWLSLGYLARYVGEILDEFNGTIQVDNNGV
jgi:hypothetical protein